MTKKATSIKKLEETGLTELQAQNVIDIYQWTENAFREFAQSSNNSYLYPNVLSPQLLNSRMQGITISSNGGVVTEARANKALENPKQSEKELLEISEILEYSNPTYKRIISYLSNLPAWDYTYNCQNIKKPEEYKSAKYQKSLDVVKEFTDKFDVKDQFGTLIKQLLRQETFFSVFRDDGKRYVLQELPSSRCLITGRWDYGLLFSFDYTFFIQQGVSLDFYPDIFKETFSKLFIKNNANGYTPAASIDQRSDNFFAYYADCSPLDGFWGWKFSKELVSRIPQFASLFPDFAMLPSIRALQKNSYAISAAKVLFTELPFLKDTKATVKDMTSLSPKLMGEFMALVKAIIANEAVRFVEAPIQNAQALEFEHDNEMYSTYSKNVTGQSGINGNLITSTDLKMNALETGLSASVDEMLSTAIYPSCNNFMEYHINKRLEEKGLEYRFGFNFEGTNFYTDRQRRLETQTTLMSQGIILPQSIAAAIGKSPFVFQAQLDEARMNKWTDNLTPITPAAQLSGGGKAGRPSAKSDDDLGEEGMNTRDAASNIAKGTGKK